MIGQRGREEGRTFLSSGRWWNGAASSAHLRMLREVSGSSGWMVRTGLLVSEITRGESNHRFLPDPLMSLLHQSPQTHCCEQGPWWQDSKPILQLLLLFIQRHTVGVPSCGNGGFGYTRASGHGRAPRGAFLQVHGSVDQGEQCV